MKTKNGLTLFNILFMVVLAVLLIGSAVGMFFVGGYTSKSISMIIVVMAASAIMNSIYHKIFVKEKEKEKDERIINIENMAKAKAFDVMEIVFGILIIIYGFLKSNLRIIVLAVVAYLVIFVAYEAYATKYHKEM
jgi:membrane protein implicated in regulation of membrane protease activity